MIEKHLNVLALFAAISLPCASVDAGIVISSSVGGKPIDGANYVTFNSITDGGTENGLTLTLTPDAKLVTGSISGEYAAPVVSNGNGANFGGQADGVDTTRYVTSGRNTQANPAAARMSFASDQSYFGLLWGSVDTYNTLSFYDKNNLLLYSVTGSQVQANPNGNQGASGTVYANFFLDKGFRHVVATSSNYAFEFDNVAFAIPEPAAVAVWGFLGLVGFAAARRRRQLTR